MSAYLFLLMRQILKQIKNQLLVLVKSIYFKKVTANILSLSPNEYLLGKIALITGGTSGIGLSIAEAFIKSGARVVVTGRNQARLEKAKECLESKCKKKDCVLTALLDSKDIHSFGERVKSIVNECGKIDILVNNAGVIGGEWSKAVEDEYDNVMDTNLKGAFFLSRVVADHMIKNKINGNILNICSSSSLRPVNSAYALSKWGLRGLTLGLAKTLCKYGITVNGIAPGPTATPMLVKDKTGRIDNKYSPIGRMAMPEEIANMAVFLVSDFGRTVVGDVVYMTGGAGLITYDDMNYEL